MIAIHIGNQGFHQRWREYLNRCEIEYKDVDCHANDIIEQLKDCDALFWHFSHSSSRDMTKAKRLLFSLEYSGLTVFPNFYTSWHFDDKIAQKYLFEALNMPLVKSYHFIDKDQAIKWSNETSFPKVFKLKGGAGSANVKLVKNRNEAKRVINKAFGKGFKQFDKFGSLKERYRKLLIGQETISGLLKSVYRLFVEPEYSRVLGKIKNEVYFQDFIENNDFDIRIIIINNKAFAIKRLNRENDFRASGSGKILYSKEHFDENLIEMSFKYCEKLKMQSCAFDYVFQGDIPQIVEISYGFAIDGYNDCVGFWDIDMKFHPGSFDPTIWIIEMVINQLKSKNA